MNEESREPELRLARLNDGPEIFYSLQGEGHSIGHPSTFVRTSTCNLYCYWCDTDYTWNWKGTAFRHKQDHEPGYQKYDLEAQTIVLSAGDIAERILALHCRRIIFTGGEPMLQQAGLARVAALLQEGDPSHRFEVETNGTILPSLPFDRFVHQYNVSPKMGNSAVSPDRRLKSKAMEAFAADPRAYFKFVVSSERDVDEIREVIERFSLTKERVMFMPEATDRSDLRDRQLWLAEVCKEHGIRMTGRLHIELWGKERGV